MIRFLSYLGALILYILVVELIYKLVTKLKESITTKFIRKVTICTGSIIILFTFLLHTDATKDIGKTLFQSSALVIAILTFSAQKVLGNVISGLAISFSKPFDINDKIQLRSTSGNIVIDGYIIDIKLRHTLIKQVDGKVCLIPNSVIDELIVVNNNTLDTNGYPFYMVCSFDSDVDMAIEIMQETIDNHPLTIKKDEPIYKVMCSELTDDGFKLKAVIWTDNIADNFKACADLRVQIFKNWKQAGIEVPYKTITINE